jgi:heme exporter protein A
MVLSALCAENGGKLIAKKSFCEEQLSDVFEMHKVTSSTLKVQDISKHFGGTLLFENISFSLENGDVFAITGWNGSGKSTLMRIIAGLVRPSTGDIEMVSNETAVSKASKRKFIGFVAPALSLYDELTGFENLSFFHKVRGGNGDHSGCRDVMRMVGLDGQEKKTCKEYSSGMKQRLKLAQALIHKPPLLLLDEPGSNLDNKGIKIVEDIIGEQRKIGMTIIASNEKREVDYADRILNLSE